MTSSEAGEVGSWQYDFTDPEGPQMGTVAVPGSPIATDMDDPCIIVAQSDALGIPLPQNDVSMSKSLPKVACFLRLPCLDCAAAHYIFGSKI